MNTWIQRHTKKEIVASLRQFYLLKNVSLLIYLKNHLDLEPGVSNIEIKLINILKCQKSDKMGMKSINTWLFPLQGLIGFEKSNSINVNISLSS